METFYIYMVTVLCAGIVFISFLLIKKIDHLKYKNTDLQKENSKLIKINLSMQSKLETNKALLRKKKELLELQDKLLKESK